MEDDMEKLSFTQSVLEWYDAGHRSLPWRMTRDAYRIWVSEIMLQQTRAETVISYYERFLARYPTVESLAESPEEELLKMWEGLGYYSRARSLQKAAKIIVAEHGGSLPADVEKLRALPGIGDYTAGAIASIAFGIPA
ncbi:MAG: A/G-specific adenine glycosylase, partial [Clostridia bacterium]|nr:A/G-specific adenine glycosylase [Clostridia bacterium]